MIERIRVLRASLRLRFSVAEYDELYRLLALVEAGRTEPLVVTGCDPSEAVCGGEDFTLHVLGNGFTPSDIILFNGGEEPTTYLSEGELTTIVKPSLVLAPVVVAVSVVGAETSADFTFTAAP